MAKYNLGERIVMVESEINNLKNEFTKFISKLEDIHEVIVGNGKESVGLISRIKSLEELNVWKSRLSNIIILVLTCLSGYLGYLAFLI